MRRPVLVPEWRSAGNRHRKWRLGLCPEQTFSNRLQPERFFQRSQRLSEALAEAPLWELQSASEVELLLFENADDVLPARIVYLKPSTNRTYHYWHVFLPGLQAGQLYGYRVHGSFNPGQGMRFDGEKLLLDPYARGIVVPKDYCREAARKKGDTVSTPIKSEIVDKKF